MCEIEFQIGEHCNDEDATCPSCHFEALISDEDVFGSWLECTNCDYTTEEKI